MLLNGNRHPSQFSFPSHKALKYSSKACARALPDPATSSLPLPLSPKLRETAMSPRLFDLLLYFFTVASQDIKGEREKETIFTARTKTKRCLHPVTQDGGGNQFAKSSKIVLKNKMMRIRAWYTCWVLRFITEFGC